MARPTELGARDGRHARSPAVNDPAMNDPAVNGPAVNGPAPDRDPLTALVRLLAAVPSVLAGKLAATADAAAETLGVGVVLYLVDHEQRQLVPLTDHEHSVKDLERTLAGRAFRNGATVVARRQHPPRLWVPLINGFERLGVMEVVPEHPEVLDDAVLRRQLGWFANLMAHLVTAADQRGDTVQLLRRSRPYSPSAELVRGLMLAPDAGSENFTLSGRLEPAYAVGGDAFDYALEAESVDLAVFDAMGHEFQAGLIAATAVATCRAARRAGEGLSAQAAAIDDALRTHFPDAFATGVLARLDLSTGRLRYLCAGHPAPLLMRDKRVVATLAKGQRMPFGLETGELPVAEAALEPGDCLVLYTDGIVEARDPHDERRFGLDRLTDFLEREAAAGLSTWETTRRLIEAVLRHQQDQLEDDATVLLAHWTPPPAPNPSDRAEVADTDTDTDADNVIDVRGGLSV